MGIDIDIQVQIQILNTDIDYILPNKMNKCECWDIEGYEEEHPLSSPIIS